MLCKSKVSTLVLVTTCSVALVLPGCIVEFEQPYLTADNSKIDADLVGVWYMEGIGKNPMVVVKGPPMTNRYQLVVENETTKPTLYTRELAGIKLLQYESPDESITSTLVRYEITDDRLLVYLLDEDKLQAAISAGELKGKVVRKGGGLFSSGPDYKINDTPKRIEAYLLKHGKEAFAATGGEFALRKRK